MFTSTTVRTRDTVFPLFGSVGIRSATEAQLNDFGDVGGARRAKPSLAIRRPAVESEVEERNAALVEVRTTVVTTTSVAECGQIQDRCDDELRRPAPPQLQRARQ